MARIRHIEIENFRGIRYFSWWPTPGINCLIGPGDSGKSTVLDAIDLCLGARRTVQFNDADFRDLNVEEPISITITIGELDDTLKNMEMYGLYLRSFDAESETIEDEPEHEAETVLTLRLTVASDLEPVWSLVSDRAVAQQQSRNLNWTDRLKLSPTRIGAFADYNLAWRRGSVLNRLTDEKADTSAALAKAARDARTAFGDEADEQLGQTLDIALKKAKELGIEVGDKLKAMLDAHSVSFSGGTVSLHNEDGIPLRSLGVGSVRLLTAGLQREARNKGSIILVDELEHGLEPHRLARFLDSIGAKEKKPPLQAFLTTHSPVALRELVGDQLFVLREDEDEHSVQQVGIEDDLQSTIRVHPEAFLAHSVLVCEGASEVGFMRGLDQYRVDQGDRSLTSYGVALVDAGGCDNIYKRAHAFAQLGYRTAVLRDDDRQPDAQSEKAFTDRGNFLFTWQTGNTIEDELFLNLSDDGILNLLDYAVELHGDDLVDDHIKSASKSKVDLDACRDDLSDDNCALLAKAASSKANSWFKTVSRMEVVGRTIVGPDLKRASKEFSDAVSEIEEWIANGD